MGLVTKARDRRLDRLVAIKRVRSEFGSSKQALQRFLTEARAIAQLNHFNIVQVYDYGRDKTGPFLVLEYVDGPTLAEQLQAGPMDPAAAIDLACELCDGLAKAHEKGIIHRDIKPANILLTPDGHPKLTDFGLARQSEKDDGHTKAGAALGTLDFMAPEQRRNAKAADPRSDLWSLAATLYQTLTGKSPRVIRLDDVPTALREVLNKALADDPQMRFASAIDLRDALNDVRAEVRAAAEPILDEGTCPSCRTVNDIARKFCRKCRASLVTKCLAADCGKELRAWDDICGECGASQRELLQALRAEAEAMLDQAASISREHRYAEAIALCGVARAKFGDTLIGFSAKAEATVREISDAQEEMTRLVENVGATAFTYAASNEYENALREIETIPSAFQTDYLRSVANKCRTAISKRDELLAKIKSRIRKKQYDGLEVLTGSYLTFDPHHHQMQRVHAAILERSAAASKLEDESPESQEDDVSESNATANNLSRKKRFEWTNRRVALAVGVPLVALWLAAQWANQRMADDKTSDPLKLQQAGQETTSTSATPDLKVDIRLVEVPAGRFLMGGDQSPAEIVRLEKSFGRTALASLHADEQPQHAVQFTKSYYMGAYEITQEEWTTVMGSNPSHYSHLGLLKDEVQGLDTSRFPVENISWFDSLEFCNRLSIAHSLFPYYQMTNVERYESGTIHSATVTILGGNGYRLPSEAEWEYACRGGTTSPFHFGDSNNGTLANIFGQEPYGTATIGPVLSQGNCTSGV
jgi:serine/threonine protein kinase